MGENDHSKWDKKHMDPEFELPEYPIPILEDIIDSLPDGRALDVATGTGRNAIYLADNGYTVDAVDVSDVGLREAQEKAKNTGVSVNWIQADVIEYPLSDNSYSVITMSYFTALEMIPKLKDALEPGGYLIIELHLRTTDEIDYGPDDQKKRLRASELLHACLDLTILHYSAHRRRSKDDTDKQNAVCTIVARNTHGDTQSYPLWTDWSVSSNS